MIIHRPVLAGEGAPAAAPPATPPAGGAPEGGAPAAVPEKPVVPAVDPKKLAGFAADFLGKQFDGPPPAVEPKPKPGDAPKPGAAPGAAPEGGEPTPPAVPPKAKTKKPVKVAPKIEPKNEPEPGLTADQIARAAAKGVAEVMKPAGVTTPPPTELPPVEQRRVATLKHMEAMYPDLYPGIADRYQQSLLELQKYAEDWEKAHPGETFDESAEEHEAFFAKHPVDWEDDHYTEALADIRATAKMEEERKQSDARMSKLEQGERLRQASPEIAGHQTRGAAVFWYNTTRELQGVIKQDGTVDVALLTDLSKKDPIGYRMRVGAANALNAEVAELYKVMNGLAPFNEKNEVHIVMGNFCSQMERQMVTKPDEEQRDGEGRKFLPAKQYWQLPKDRREGYYWTFSPDELAALRAHTLATTTEKMIAEEREKQREWALASGWTPPEGAAIGAEAGGGAGDGSSVPAGGKPVSPGGAADSRLHANSRPGVRADQNFLSDFQKKQMGQS